MKKHHEFVLYNINYDDLGIFQQLQNASCFIRLDKWKRIRNTINDNVKQTQCFRMKILFNLIYLIKEQYKDKISDSSASQFVCSLLLLVSRSDVNKNVDVRMFGQI